MQMPDPDDVSRDESGEVSLEFSSGTEKTLKRAAIIFAIVLLAAFAVVKALRLIDAHSLAKSADRAFAAPPPVDVVLAQAARAGQPLVLPGQTAAWFETT